MNLLHNWALGCSLYIEMEFQNSFLQNPVENNFQMLDHSSQYIHHLTRIYSRNHFGYYYLMGIVITMSLYHSHSIPPDGLPPEGLPPDDPPPQLSTRLQSLHWDGVPEQLPPNLAEKQLPEVRPYDTVHPPLAFIVAILGCGNCCAYADCFEIT